MRSHYHLVCSALLILAFQRTGCSATINAASPSAIDVQTAINTAAAGDTIMIPAGSATWTTSVTITNKSLVLIGGGIDLTTITRNTTGNDSPAVLIVTMRSTDTFTMKGFTWKTVNKSNNGIVQLSSPNNDGTYPAQFRITNCKFIMTPTGVGIGGGSSRGLDFSGPYGLVDHCHFISTNNSGGQMVTVDRNSSFACINTWHTPQFWGDTKCVCFEDNFFDAAAPNDGAFDTYEGCRVTFRHNTVRNTNTGGHGYDSAARSARSFEIYQNTFYSDDGASGA